MYVLITYDVNTSTPDGRRRLQRVARICLNHGQRVQNSVFECLVNESQYVTLKSAIESIIDSSLDSVRFYHLGRNYQSKINYLGVKTSFDMEGDLII